MVGKAGLEAERAFVVRVWQDEHSFALMHDLTTCLRIGDATVFKSTGEGYEAYLEEIKSDPNRRKAQQVHRKRLAEEAIRDGGPLPGDSAARFVRLNVVYKTHLDLAGQGLGRRRCRARVCVVAGRGMYPQDSCCA